MFTYNAAELDALTTTLSADRLSTYLRIARGDRLRAIQAYEHNIRVSESLFGVIRGLEVSLRNSIHDTLTARLSTDAWYDAFPARLLKNEARSIRVAKLRIRQRGKTVVPGRVVAELAFGFWAGSTSKPYDASLWVPHLHRAFPNKRLGRKEANAQMERHRTLRNRIAHHECILNINLEEENAALMQTIGWICPVTSEWVREYSTFNDSMAQLKAWRVRR